MQFEFNRETKARIHLAILDVLSDDDTYRAYAETVAYAAFPGEIFELSRAIDAHLSTALHRADVQYVDVDADDLRATLDAETVNLALRLCGVRPRASGSRMRWTNAPDNEPTMPIKLPANLLDDWFAG